MKRRLSVAVPTLVLAGALVVLALGGSNVSTSSAQGTTLPTITLTMSDTSIAASGTLQSGAVNIHAVTTRKKGSSPGLLLLNPGVTADQAWALLASKAGEDPNNLSKVGKIVFDASLDKGSADFQTVLPAGNYLVADIPDNPKTGTHTSMTISAASAPAALPAAKATVRAIDFRFAGAKTLRRGDLVRFRNDGFVVHMIIGIRVKNARDARRLEHALRAGKDKAAEKLARGFVSFQDPVSTGAVQQEVVKAAPGTYVLACFMDTQDGREHTRLGMYRTIRIRG